MSTAFTFDPGRAELVMDTFALASDSANPYGYEGDDFTQGLMMALVSAEQVAAAAGFGVSVAMPDGSSSILIGGAYKKIKAGDGVPVDVRTVYLAAYAAVRDASDRAIRRPAGSRAPLGIEPLPEPVSPTVSSSDKIAPFVVAALVVVALGAIIATAWYAISGRSTEIEVAGQNLRRTALATTYSGIAAAALTAGQPIPPEVWQGLSALAALEEQRGVWVWPVAIGATLATGGAAWWLVKRHRGRR